jgi:hypothetical protein
MRNPLSTDYSSAVVGHVDIEMIVKTKMNDAFAAHSARGAQPHDQMMR